MPVFDRDDDADRERSRADSIFIAGDASNDMPLLHEAADEGRIAGENAGALSRTVRPGLRRAPLGVVFTDPQIAIVGGGYAALAPGRFVTGAGVASRTRAAPRDAQEPRPAATSTRDIATGRLLGAEMIGPAAEHLGHLLAWALQMDDDDRADARDAVLSPGHRGRPAHRVARRAREAQGCRRTRDAARGLIPAV